MNLTQSLPTRASLASPELRHRLLLGLAGVGIALVILSLLHFGWPYYSLPIEDRPQSSLHSLLRPGGAIGIRLGLVGVLMFAIIFLYPLRKRWPKLARIGNTRRWLNFHILLGISAPILITIHSSFKTRGLAGMAYWIMLAVAASGLVGRYLYGLIPRSVHATELDRRQIESSIEQLTHNLATISSLPATAWSRIFLLPDNGHLSNTHFPIAILHILALDLRRAFRRHGIRYGWLRLDSSPLTIEQRDALLTGFAVASDLSRLVSRLALLTRTQRLFNLWHVVHRPFSFAFVLLTVVHITVALLFGYF